MNGLPYYKRFPRDFIEGTIGMPFEVKAAYSVVLDLIYMQGGNLPDDARYISGLLGCSLRKWKSLRQALIDAGKIQVNGEFLTNYRAVSELETLAKLQDKQRENRSRPNKNNDIQSPRSDHTEPEPYIEETNVSSTKAISPETGFSEFWEICPNKVAKQAALKAWRKLDMPARRAAFSAVKRGWFDDWQRRHPQASPLHPATFLNQRRWEDQPQENTFTAIPGGKTHGKRSVTERLFGSAAGMDQREDRNTSEPLFQAGDRREDRSGSNGGLDQGPVAILQVGYLRGM